MIILKVGGGKNINWEYIAADLKHINEQVIIIHGANAWMKEVSEKLGVLEKIITSPSGYVSRYSDEKTMDVLTMVYSGLINKRIVAILQRYNINAIGLTGVDGKLWLGKRKEAIFSQEGKKTKVIKDSLTGNVISVNVSLLELLLSRGYTPVMTVPAITKFGEMINVDNDRAVAVMAKDLETKRIIMLFEAPGLLANPEDENSKISSITADELEKYLMQITGRMRKKLLGVKEAFSFGVKKVYFGDGRIENPITSALSGNGTVITNEYE